VKSWLIFLLFLAPTIQYRFAFGSFTISILEPIVLVVSSILLMQAMLNKRFIVITQEPFLYFIVAIIVWSFFVGLQANDLQSGLSEVRNWAIPSIGFITLISTVGYGWRKWVIIFFALAIISSLIGVYQHVTDSFRPVVAESAFAKRVIWQGSEADGLEFASFANGFFAHPNEFAIYLFISLMMGIGWVIDKGQHYMWRLPLLIPIIMALYWTYAKASIVVMIISIGLFLIHLLTKPNNQYRLAITFGTFLAVGCLWGTIDYLPAGWVSTFEWRAGLWQIVLSLTNAYPLQFLLGNGMEIFRLHAYYPQPHNVYFYIFLQYGLFGLIWLLFFVRYIWKWGWAIRQTSMLHAQPILAALWIALLGYFLIGLVESTMLSIELRTIFFWVAACFIGLHREIQAITYVTQVNAVAPEMHFNQGFTYP
jgi:hypothetical protein